MNSIASIRQLLNQGQYRAALQQLAPLLPQDDSTSAASQRDLYYLQVVAHRLLGEFDSARSAAETLLALDRCWLWTANTHERSRNWVISTWD